MAVKTNMARVTTLIWPTVKLRHYHSLYTLHECGQRHFNFI